MMLAGQSLAREVRHNLANSALLSLSALLDSEKNVIIDRQRGAHASDANTSSRLSTAPRTDYQVTSGSSMSIGNGRSSFTLRRKTPVGA